MTRSDDHELPGLGPDELQRLRAFARAITRGTPLQADDVVADTLAIALRSNARPEPAGALGPWLRGIARNVVRNGARAEQRRSDRERSSARSEADDDDDPARRAIATEDAAALGAALRGLAPAARSVVEQHYLKGAALHAIARASGEPAGTVRSRLQRGLATLRAVFERGDTRRRCIVTLGAFATAAGLILVARSALETPVRATPPAPSKPSGERARLSLPRTPAPAGGSELVTAPAGHENLPSKRRSPFPPATPSETIATGAAKTGAEVATAR